jgi:hypothetical protein
MPFKSVHPANQRDAHAAASFLILIFIIIMLAKKLLVSVVVSPIDLGPAGDRALE